MISNTGGGLTSDSCLAKCHQEGAASFNFELSGGSYFLCNYKLAKFARAILFRSGLSAELLDFASYEK